MVVMRAPFDRARSVKCARAPRVRRRQVFTPPATPPALRRAPQRCGRLGAPRAGGAPSSRWRRQP
eukprot:7769119-Karenia_brevis.AAC.1